MDRVQIKQQIMNVLRDNGVFMNDNESELNELMEIDSLTYVSVMVDLESALDVELDELTIAEQDVTYAVFIDKIADLVEQKLKEI